MTASSCRGPRASAGFTLPGIGAGSGVVRAGVAGVVLSGTIVGGVVVVGTGTRTGDDSDDDGDAVDPVVADASDAGEFAAGDPGVEGAGRVADPIAPGNGSGLATPAVVAHADATMVQAASPANRACDFPYVTTFRRIGRKTLRR